MTHKNQKLHLHIKGKLKNHLYPLFTTLQTYLLGLKTHKLEDRADGGLEMVVEGETHNLWKLVNWSKKGYFFLMVDEIIFRFY